MVLHEYDYIFAIGTLFAMLDAYNNGASKSLMHSSFCISDS
jgi:sodium-dependent phosphate transporter